MSSAIERMSIPNREVGSGKTLNEMLRETAERRAAAAKQAKDFRLPTSLSKAMGRDKVPQEDAKIAEQGGKGKSEGELSRPTHSSFYQPLPVNGMAPPKQDERSRAIEANESVKRRGRGRSI